MKRQLGLAEAIVSRRTAVVIDALFLSFGPPAAMIWITLPSKCLTGDGCSRRRPAAIFQRRRPPISVARTNVA